MDRFDHILHWRLQQGSHTFPGKDGGTCINEAAIVAAGFPYQPVGSVRHAGLLLAPDLSVRDAPE